MSPAPPSKTARMTARSGSRVSTNKNPPASPSPSQSAVCPARSVTSGSPGHIRPCFTCHCYDTSRRRNVTVDEQEWLAERFDEHRSHLRAVAYRMLGSLSEADDAVQEAWLRVSRTDASAVENLGGWLTTVVGRVSLNMLRSRKARREEPLGVHLPDPILDRADGMSPEHEALLADSVGLALLVVLETLSPPERLCFVLHERGPRPLELPPEILPRADTLHRDTDQATECLRQANLTLGIASIWFAGRPGRPVRGSRRYRAYMGAWINLPKPVTSPCSSSARSVDANKSEAKHTNAALLERSASLSGTSIPALRFRTR